MKTITPGEEGRPAPMVPSPHSEQFELEVMNFIKDNTYNPTNFETNEWMIPDVAEFATKLINRFNIKQ